MAAMNDSGGLVDAVTDDEILQAYQLLASEEGIFVEPASAASVAGLLKLAANKYFDNGPQTVVCTLTGHGLKDPDTAIDLFSEPDQIPPQTEALVDLLGL